MVGGLQMPGGESVHAAARRGGMAHRHRYW